MKADFDSAKVNIGLGEVYFLLVRGHFCSAETDFASGEVNFGPAGEAIWVGGRRILLGRFRFCEW